MKTIAVLPKIWWSSCSTHGYGEIEYCYPKVDIKKEE